MVHILFPTNRKRKAHFGKNIVMQMGAVWRYSPQISWSGVDVSLLMTGITKARQEGNMEFRATNKDTKQQNIDTVKLYKNKQNSKQSLFQCQCLHRPEHQSKPYVECRAACANISERTFKVIICHSASAKEGLERKAPL